MRTRPQTTCLLSTVSSSLTGFLMLTACGVATAGIAQSPLFLTVGIKPNIMLALDDSGSMDNEVVFPTNDGALWWNTDTESFVGLNQLDETADGDVFNFNRTGQAAGKWYKYVYLFPNGKQRNPQKLLKNAHFVVPPIPRFAFARSPDYNRAYFDPRVTYTPWTKADGSRYPDISPTAAPDDPIDDIGTTLDLTADVRDATDEHHEFLMMPGMVLPKGTIVYQDGSWSALAADKSYTEPTFEAIEYFPATFWLTSAAELPAGYGWKADAQPLTGKGPDGEPVYGYEIRPDNFIDGEHYQAAIQNFANWFSYFRKRYLAVRGAVTAAFATISDARAGEFTINKRPGTEDRLPIRDLADAAERAAFYSDLFSLLPIGATANRQAVDAMGQQYQRTDDEAPVRYACQKNFGILFTDGYTDTALLDDVENEDGDMDVPFKDSYSDTLADVAAKYYKGNLRSDLTDGVDPKALDERLPAQCRDDSGNLVANPDPRLDCNPYPHMEFYAVTLGGQRGTIYNVNADATADPYTNPPAWPNPTTSRSPTAIDDLWHATINARGALLSAATPADVATQLRKVLVTIAHEAGSPASVAASSTQLQSDTAIYRADFSSDDWHGQLSAYKLDDKTGEIEGLGPAWATAVPDDTGRSIFTWDGDSGVRFKWDNLSQQEKLALELGTSATDAATAGQARLAYLRGDRSREGTGPQEYRVRNAGTVLGDIVNSSPLYVGDQDFGYASTDAPGHDTYAKYVSITKANRTPELYVGANDGMLHAFNANDGKELLAYVPQGVYPKLIALTDKNYKTEHQYLVDGSPTQADACLGGVPCTWGTYIVGTLGADGKGVFALKVSDSGSFTTNDVLWEFSTATIPGSDTPLQTPATNTHNYDSTAFDDLGYSIPDASVVLLRNKNGTFRWAAIVANGYGSKTETAALYVIDLETGDLIRELDTDATGGNGLSSPLPVDVDGDKVFDYVYAGDLKGNLWKFNLASDPANWHIAGIDGEKAPLFITPCSDPANCAATHQPITARPEVGAYPTGGVMVYVGTGKYFEDGDQKVDDSPQTQSFYGIRDRSVAVGDATAADAAFKTVKLSALLRQTFTADIQSNGETVRSASDKAIAGSNDGWVIDLPAPGERQVSSPILNNGRIIFTTLIPHSDPCGTGTSSFLVILDAFTGGRLDFSPLDINGDQKFDDGDKVDVGGTTAFVSAIKSDSNIESQVALITLSPGTERAFGNDSWLMNRGPNIGPQSWHQLH